MSRKPEPISFTTAVYQAVVKLGKANAAQVLAEVKHLIPNNLAVHAGKRILETESKQYNHIAGGMKRKASNPIYTTERLAEIGKKNRVYRALQELAKKRLTTKVSKGVYSPNLVVTSSAIKELMVKELTKRGKSTIKEMVNLFGNLLEESKVIHKAEDTIIREFKQKRRSDVSLYSRKEKLSLGKYIIIKQYMQNLRNKKQIKRLHKGLYASLDYVEENT